MLNESEIVFLRKIYAELCAGYSIYDLNSKECYIRHFGIIDDLQTDTLYTNQLNKLKQKKVFTESEKLNYLIKNELWDKKQEEKIKFVQETLKDLYTNKRKVFKPADIEFYRGQIEENEKFLNKILVERWNLLGETAEVLARKSSDLLLIKKSFFKDAGLKKPFHTDKQFEDLSAEEVDSLFSLYNKFQNDVSEKNIKKIAVQRFFHDLYFLSQSPTDFFGKSLIQMTHVQSKLLIYGGYFKGILENNSIPDDIMDNAEAIEEWASGRKNIVEVIEKQEASGGDNAVVSLPGVNKEILKRYGIDNPQGNANDQKLATKLKESGGELSTQQMIELGLA
jgi:hypothetical protein